MAQADSIFLLEIVVESLTSFNNCREFCIKSQFADVFNINLKDPNEETPSLLSNRPKRFTTRKTKPPKVPPPPKIQTGVTVLFERNVETLISNMKQYPMELSLWSKVVTDYKIGSTQIPWSDAFHKYLAKLHKRQEPLCVTGDYNIFDEYTSKRMAVIKLNVKLTRIQNNSTTGSRPQSEGTELDIMHTGFTSPSSDLSTIKDRAFSLSEQTGTIKTIYSGEDRKLKRSNRKKNRTTKRNKIGENKERILESTDVDNSKGSRKLHNGLVMLIKSETDLDNKQKDSEISNKKPKSCSSLTKDHFNTLNYIFGGKPTGPFGNRVYYVGYFTVENDLVKSPTSVESPKTASVKSPTKSKSPSERTKSPSERSNSPSGKSEGKYTFTICKSDCPSKKGSRHSVCSLDLPVEASHLISVKKCDLVGCDNRTMRKLPTPPSDRILIDLSSRDRDCCDVAKKVEEVVGGITAKMKFSEDDPCYCECECSFGFTKKTTFCNICGGYEVPGDEYAQVPGYELPFPCPIFHKLVEKGKLKTISTSGSDIKREKKEPDTKKEKKEVNELKKEKPSESKKDKKEKKEPSDSKKEKKDPSDKKDKKEASDKKKETKQKTTSSGKSVESDKESKKSKKKRKDDRFKFNYGYTAPHIGHSRCLLPCGGGIIVGGGGHTGHGGRGLSGVVPRNMGWLWTAENVPGVKFRPQWKPGATTKHVVRLLKIAKNPGEVLAKKRKKKDLGKSKRPLKRPLLTVAKKHGEYTVTMETMKTFSKPRTFNQYPYEDKPLVTYTIGRTSEENLERKKKKERAHRRLERLQRDFIQSAFRDMCQEICLKTYQQALGILPDAEKSDCPCYPAEPGADRTDLDHSCSCSEDKDLTESDTDSDEWIVEFTPPTATFDPSFKAKKVVTADSSSQYTYLDYRVKLLDRYGNPVPRYFKGPDGKQQCSDLGGFWGPNHKWLEINVDGYIGPDEKWAPNFFIGPNGEQVDGEAGKFQAMDGTWLVVGVDGYVDAQGKWKFYPKAREIEQRKPRSVRGKKSARTKKPCKKISEGSWSCFGDVSPKRLSKMGIIGHGADKKLLLSKLKQMQAQGEDVKIPEPSIIPRSSKSRGKFRRRRRFVEEKKCKHATPSHKGVVAVDEHGNKTYFRLKEYSNKRPKNRIANLTDQGISLSSFHLPCFHSFISTEIMKKQQYDRLVALAKAKTKSSGGGGGGGGRHDAQRCTTASTQADYVYVV